MAKKKKRRPRARPAGTPTSSGASTSAGADARTGPATSASRREKKEMARAAREAERKRRARTATLRRASVFALLGLTAFAVLWWFQRAPGPRPISQAAVRAASAAGCTTPTHPSGGDAPGGQHLEPGQAYTYDQHPATSGPHDPSPLPDEPNLYAEPVPETQAVHTLEHAGILVYYRSDGEGALPAATVDALGTVVDGAENTILAPYDDLPDGVSLALAAWDTLQTCPGTITEGQARTVTQGFIDAYVCTGNAPEPTASSEC
jgi:hypothetical protein